MTEPDTASSPPSAEKTSTPPASRDNPITSNEPPSFHPDQITLATFKHLLSCYPQTVEQVHRRKITLKLQPKASKSAKRKANTNPTQQTQPDPSSEEHIRTETDKFIELDTWRYEHMPRILASRAHNNDVYLHKEELIRIMEWKLKHGHFRPALLGMIKSNPEPLVRKCTSSAISLLGSTFPKDSVDALAPLRGVGIATASLILSIAGDVPFYSDDLFLWLVGGVYPGTESRKYVKANGEPDVRYNVNEYRMLWDAAGKLKGRLNGEGEGRVSFVDVERVAYVLRNFEGGYGGMDVDGERKRKRTREEDGDEDEAYDMDT